MKLISYSRISSKKQLDNSSLTSQTEQIKNYCKAYNHEIVSSYLEQASGKTIKRAELNKLLAELIATNSDGILVYSIQRLTRNVSDINIIIDFLKQNNKTLLSVSENIDISTPSGVFMVNVLTSVNQMDRELIIQKTMLGKETKAKEGFHTAGKPSRLKKAIKVTSDKGIEGTILVNDIETKKLKRTINVYVGKGYSYSKIADTLNSKGITTKYGKAFSKQSVMEYCKA